VGTQVLAQRQFLLVSLLSFIVISGCGEPCNYALLSETKSPDMRLKAIVFQRGCGVPIDSSTQISVLNSRESRWGQGNLFIVGDDHHNGSPGNTPLKNITVHWESNTSLKISYPKNTQVLLKNPNIAGVAVSYDVVP
jgi:hypothetical protein